MVRFSTVKCISTIFFGLSFEDLVGVQQNTMKRKGKSSDNDKTHKKRLEWTFQNKKNARIIVETTITVKSFLY